MNAPLRKVAISVLVLFTLLILNINYIQVVRSDELREDGRNTRLLADEYSRERGAIVVDGEPIALSVPTDDRLKYLRQYPQAGLYAAVTGYYSVIYGATGIEKAENALLAGTDDRLFVRRISDLFTGRDPSGGDVVLTLDPAVQQAAMAGLEGQVGAVVALDPTTGAVLGLASTPTFDPNALASHDLDGVRDTADLLEAADPDPRSNQAISQRYSPGSIFKVIVSAAALEDGYTPETVIPAPQTLTLPGTRTELENFNGSACDPSGQQQLIEALTISCNTAFAQLGIDLGEDAVREMAEAFGMTGESFEMPLARRGEHRRGHRERRRAGRQLDRPAGRADDPHAGGDDRGRRGQRRHPDEALPGRPAARPRPHRHRRDRPRGLQRADLDRRRRPAHRDDDQRGGQRLRPEGADQRRAGGRQDRDGGERRAPTTTGSSGSRRPTSRRSPSRCSCATVAAPAATPPRRSPAR